MSWTRERARIASYCAQHPGEQAPDEMYRDLRAERLAEYVARVVAQAPPLTDEQRNRIAALLRPVGGAA